MVLEPCNATFNSGIFIYIILRKNIGKTVTPWGS